MTEPPKPATTCWGPALVSSCLASSVLVQLLGPGTVPFRNCRIVVLLGPDRLQYVSICPSTYPFIRTRYGRPYCPDCIHPAFRSVSQASLCLRLNAAAAVG